MPFDRVIGTDPSPGMIKQAQAKNSRLNVEFKQASAESSPFIKDGEVDCVIAAQAAHWFDYEKLWPELKRILRKGGTVAFWGYKDPALVDYPKATKILDQNTYGEDPETLGPYWSQPGRSYVQNKLRVIQPPPADFQDVERIEYEPACKGPRSGEGTVFMEKSLSIKEMKDYYRTWSSFHGWQEAHPEDIARSKGGRGDILDRMVDEMATQDNYFENEENLVSMEWGSGLVMCRRR